MATDTLAKALGRTELNAYDITSARLNELEALSSCVAVLGASERRSSLGYELSDDALPTLALVMIRLAQEGQAAALELWGGACAEKLR